MDEFQTINQIVDESIRSSSYISVLISSGVFITYTLINKLIELFKDKSRNKPLVEMAEGLREVTANVVKLNSVLDKTLNDAEKKETAKAKGIIPIVFNTFCNAVTRSCVDMIINNHIETNKDLINENVNKLVTTEYYKVHAVLSTYEVNGSNLATKLEKEWIRFSKGAIDGLYQIIYSLTKQDDAILINTCGFILDAKKEAIEVLKSGNVICLFPEGTRNLTENPLLPFKYGAISFAYNSQKPIVPFAIVGSKRPHPFYYHSKII